MIIGNLHQLEAEKARLPEVIYSLLLKVQELNFKELAPGRYELGDGHYMNIDEAKTEPIEARKYESHRLYADIQLSIIGQEYVGYAPLCEMGEPTEVYDERDLYFYGVKEEGLLIPLVEDRFVVLYPEDAHRPLIARGAAGAVKKAIIKVRL